MVHLHGFLVHPKHTWEEVQAALTRTFAGTRAVDVREITDSYRYGRTDDGIETYANYFTDKSGVVKGNLRRSSDPREQTLIFDAYALMSKGTRRRPGMKIGKLPSGGSVPDRQSIYVPSPLVQTNLRMEDHRQPHRTRPSDGKPREFRLERRPC